ncbi:hypothetical protein BJX62DRAFT_209184 [Aspergillus germanicus]
MDSQYSSLPIVVRFYIAQHICYTWYYLVVHGRPQMVTEARGLMKPRVSSNEKSLRRTWRVLQGVSKPEGRS